MKLPKDDLFRVIRAMTPAEKRYFKVHFASEGSVLTELFDVLNAEEEYLEERVKEQLPENVCRNFKVYKQQLQQLLMQSLVAFHRRRSVVSKIRSGLEEVDVYVEKQLHDLALNQLEKTRRLCVDYEEYTYLVEIAVREYALRHLSIDKPGLASLPLFEEINLYLERLGNQVRLTKLGNELIDLLRTTGAQGMKESQSGRLEELLEKELNGWNPRLSFKEKISLNFLGALVSMLSEREEEEYKYRLANVELFRQHPGFQENLPWQYLGVLRNYLNYCSKHEHLFEEVPQLVKEAERLADQHKIARAPLIYIYYTELEVAYRRQSFAYIRKELAARLLRHLKQYGIEQERIAMNTYSILFMASLAEGEYGEASAFIRRMQEAGPDLHSMFRDLTFMLEWILHFDSKDEWLADNLLKSFQRRLSEEEQKSDVFLRDLMTLFKELLASKSGQRTQVANRFLGTLSGYKKQGLYIYFDYLQLGRWLKQVAAGVPGVMGV